LRFSSSYRPLRSRRKARQERHCDRRVSALTTTCTHFSARQGMVLCLIVRPDHAKNKTLCVHCDFAVQKLLAVLIQKIQLARLWRVNPACPPIFLEGLKK